MKTRVTELLGIEHPIIQCGMTNVATPDMVIAVAKAGGLGFLPLGNIPLDEYREQIRYIKENVGNRPFGVNASPMAPGAAEYIKIWIEEKVPVWGSAIRDPFSAFGVKKPTDVIYIPTIGHPKHAAGLVKKGLADAVITHGQEGGGHPGTLSSTVLVTKTAEKLSVPVIASGGFCDGRGLATALTMGAEGIGMGTRFALSAESNIPEAARQWMSTKQEESAIHSNKYDGVWCNVIQGDKVGNYHTWRCHPWQIISSMAFNCAPAHPSVSELMRVAKMMHAAHLDPVQWCVGQPDFCNGLVNGDTDKGLFWSGQTIGRIQDYSPTCQEIIETTVRDAEAILRETYAKYCEQ